MSLPQKTVGAMPLAEERRRFQRVRVNLLGRYLLADRRITVEESVLRTQNLAIFL